MVLKFYDAPLDVDTSQIRVVITAQDADSGEHVECRISRLVLTERYGAQSVATDKLLAAFDDNRKEILEVIQRKYTENVDVERTDSGARLYLELADFGPI